MPIFGSNSNNTMDPEVRQIEKTVAREAKMDQKNMDHAVKDLNSAEKTHNKSIKEADKAQHNLDKAVKQEHNAAKAVNQAQHKHQVAVSGEESAQKTVQIKKQHEERLRQDLQQRDAAVNEMRQRKESADVRVLLLPSLAPTQLTPDKVGREQKLSQIHERAAERLSRRNTYDNGNDEHQQNAQLDRGAPAGGVPHPDLTIPGPGPNVNQGAAGAAGY
ncbi:hypothetical protein OBBRIDRAFT_448135 [Obba rivulosa]|uniref:Uncharacterized protein n=1 Tax=Obba rivulosa TaxID=1052685 RepID=A0A8E2J6S4_9APHY|nr:hypothetical protein OBBRIDRAFT_448135 [Obba rivulosa]